MGAMPQKNHFEFKRTIFEEHSNILKNLFQILKYILCYWKVPGILKILQVTIDSNKEPSFLRVYKEQSTAIKLFHGC